MKSTRREFKILAWLSIAFAFVQLATLVITQNQFRYLAPLVPVSFTLMAVFLSDNRQLIFHRHRYVLLSVLICASILVDYRFALRARSDSEDSAREMAQLSAYIESAIQPNERAMLESSEDSYGISLAIKIDFGLNPRPTLMVPDSYEIATYDKLLKNFSPDVLILRSDSVLADKLSNVAKITVSQLPGIFSEYSLYRTR
jgi:hypothetical protein